MTPEPITTVQLVPLSFKERVGHGKLIAKASGLPITFLASLLKGWPGESEQCCWYGDTEVIHEGRSRRIADLMIEYALQARLHQSWIPVRFHCLGNGCINPHHYRVVSFKRDAYGRFIPDETFPKGAFLLQSGDWQDRLPPLIRSVPNWEDCDLRDIQQRCPDLPLFHLKAQRESMNKRGGLGRNEVKSDSTILD